MAITRIKEKAGGFGGGWSLQDGREYTVVCTVYSNSRLDGPKLVMESLGLNVGATYRYPLTSPATETDSRSWLNSIRIGASKVLDEGFAVEVEVTFKPLDPSKDEKGPVDEEGNRNPFLAPPTLRGYGEDEEGVPTHDRDGEPLLNAAGDPFDPSEIAVPRSAMNYEITRTERRFSRDRITRLKNHVNDAEWMGFPAGSILCRDVAADRQWNADVGDFVWSVTYKFGYKPPIVVDAGGDDVTIYHGWAKQILDAGLREKRDGKKVPIKVGGLPVSKPWLLKEDGTAYPEGSTDEPRYLVRNLIPTADFSELDFPADLFSAGTDEPPPPEEPEEP